MTSGKKARQERQAKIDAAAPKPSRSRAIVGIAVALIVVIGVGGAIWAGTRGGSAPASAAYPAGATAADGGIVVNGDKVLAGAPTLDIYEDFQCPACKSAEEYLGQTIESLSSSGKAKVVYHIKNFLEATPSFTSLGKTSSTRTGVGAACAADAGRFIQYHDAVFAAQPEQEGTGYTDEQILQLGTTAGISGGALDTFTQCVKDQKYKGYIAKVEDKSARDGVTATPTFRVNGEAIKLSATTTPEQFSAMVLAKTTAPSVATASATAPATASATK